MKKHYVVLSKEHGEALFPEPGRDHLRAAIDQMTNAYGAILVTLTPGHYSAEKLENGNTLVAFWNGERSEKEGES